MRCFISNNGLENILLTNEELGKKLTEGRSPNKGIMDCLAAAIEESCIIIKHFDYSMVGLCYLCESTSVGNPNVRVLQQNSKDCYEQFGIITVVTSIRGYANSFYAQTLNVRRDMLDPMIRKHLIDEFLQENP